MPLNMFLLPLAVRLTFESVKQLTIYWGKGAELKRSLRYQVSYASSSLGMCHDVYRFTVLKRRGISCELTVSDLRLPPKIDIVTLRNVVSPFRNSLNEDLETAFNALILLAEEINKTLEQYTDQFGEPTQEAENTIGDLFFSLSCFYILCHEIHSKMFRFRYSNDLTGEQAVERVANEFLLPYHVHDVIEAGLSRTALPLPA